MAQALLLTLPGTPCLYQGEELGLPEADVPYDKLVDPYGITFWPTFKGRDGCRTPMPWSDQAHGGFTEAIVTPWLPVPTEHLMRSAASQVNEPQSILALTKRLLTFRRGHPALQGEDFSLVGSDPRVLVFDRRGGGQVLRCCFNLSHESTSVRLDDGADWALAEVGEGSERSAPDVLKLAPWSWAFLGRM